MFILRRINGAGIQWNRCLGKDYQLIRDTDGPEFEKLLKSEAYYESLKSDIYGFLTYNDGRKILPLYKNQENYIMVSDGLTFANITHLK